MTKGCRCTVRWTCTWGENWKRPRHRASVPLELGCTTPSTPMATNLDVPWTQYCEELFGGFQPTETTDRYLNLLTSSLPGGWGVGLKVSKCLILSGDQTLTWSHPELPHQDKWHSSPRKVQGFEMVLCQQPGSDQTLEQRMLLVLLSLRKAQRF